MSRIEIRKRGEVMAKEHRGFLRRYLGLAIPISFQLLMWEIVPACDAFMLGRVGQDAMAAVSLASQVPFIMYMLVAAFSVGVSVLGAQYYGKGDDVIRNLGRRSLGF